jgi:hypothetical protein
MIQQRRENNLLPPNDIEQSSRHRRVTTRRSAALPSRPRSPHSHGIAEIWTSCRKAIGNERRRWSDSSNSRPSHLTSASSYSGARPLVNPQILSDHFYVLSLMMCNCRLPTPLRWHLTHVGQSRTLKWDLEWQQDTPNRTWDYSPHQRTIGRRAAPFRVLAAG